MKPTVRAELAPTAWCAGQQAQNGPQAQRLMAGVGSSSFHMEIRPVTPTWWWSPVELVGSRRPVVGRVGNPQGCPSGHPQESAAGAQSGSLRKRACPQIHRTFH